jgi:AbiV family abortive infection protein
MATKCGECQLELPDDTSSTAEGRQPCPNCGSKRRAYSLTAETGHLQITGGTADLRVMRYSEILLETAQTLFDLEFYGPAVIIAHTACEVAVARIFRQRLSGGAAESAMKKANLGRKSTRKLYKELTGDDPATPGTTWAEFKQSVNRRNKCAHEGYAPNKSEAQSSLQATKSIVTRVIQHF